MQAARQANESAPNDAEIVTAIAAVVGAIGVAFVALQVRQEKKSRQAAIAVDMSRRWDEQTLVDSRTMVRYLGSTPEQFAEHIWRLREQNHDDLHKLLCEANYFEDLGVLYRIKAIDVRWIELSLGTTVRARWSLWGAYAELYNDRIVPKPKRGTLYENFGRLARRLERRYIGWRGYLGIGPTAREAGQAEGQAGGLDASRLPSPSLTWWILPFSRSVQPRRY